MRPSKGCQTPLNSTTAIQPSPSASIRPSLLLSVRNRIVPSDLLNIRNLKEIGRVGAADFQLPGAAFAVLLAAFQAVRSGVSTMCAARKQVSIMDAFVEEGKPGGDVM